MIVCLCQCANDNHFDEEVIYLDYTVISIRGSADIIIPHFWDQVPLPYDPALLILGSSI